MFPFNMNAVLLTTKYFLQRLKYLIQPAADWGPHIRKYRRNYNSGPHWQENGFISSFKMNLLGRKQLPQTEL